MSEHNLYEIASDLDLWNEYFNTSALMTDDDYESMTVVDRLKMLIAAFGMSDEGRNELAADDQYGVYVCENPTPHAQRQDGIEVLVDMEFYESLATASGTIYGNVSDSVAALIADEYGIH